MGRWIKRLLWLLLVAGVLLGAGLFALQRWVGSDDFRGRVQSQAEAALGVPVVLGQLHIDAWPVPAVALDAVELRTRDPLSAKRLELRLRLDALLSGRLEVASLVVQGAKLPQAGIDQLLAALQGKADATRAGTGTATGKPGSAQPLVVLPRRVLLTDVTWRNLRGEATTIDADATLDARGLPDELALTVRAGALQGAKLQASRAGGVKGHTQESPRSSEEAGKDASSQSGSGSHGKADTGSGSQAGTGSGSKTGSGSGSQTVSRASGQSDSRASAHSEAAASDVMDAAAGPSWNIRVQHAGGTIAGVLAVQQLAGDAAGVSVRGRFDTRNLELSALRKGVPGPLSGRLQGSTTVSARADSTAGLAAALTTHSRFTVDNAVIHGVDLAKAVQTVGLSRGGQTRLDNLAGQVTTRGSAIQLSNLAASSGALSATGDVAVAPNRALSGRVNVHLGAKMVGKAVGVPLMVAGTLDAPTVTLTRGAMLGAAIGTLVMPGVGTGAGASIGDAIGDTLKGLFGK